MHDGCLLSALLGRSAASCPCGWEGIDSRARLQRRRGGRAFASGGRLVHPLRRRLSLKTKTISTSHTHGKRRVSVVAKWLRRRRGWGREDGENVPR